MTQLLCHLWGDYILQSDWMAQNKTKASLPAAIHALLYSLPFAFLCWQANVFQTPIVYFGAEPNSSFHWKAFAVILGSHFLIDRFRLARYVVWAKNWLGPKQQWMMVEESKSDRPHSLVLDGHFPETGFWSGLRPMPPLRFCPTGYPPATADWMAVWLLIIADNTLHLTINYLALRYL